MRRALAATLLGIGLLVACAASAQQGGSDDAPIVFQADELQADQDLGLVVARGNVEIARGLHRLLADVVTYNQRTDTVTATGHVTLLEPTGEIIFADFVELTDRFNEAFAKDIRMLLTDRSRLAGNTGRRTGGVRTELRRGVYSPCDLCKDDPTRPPLWQLRAEVIAHDEEAKTVEYRDTTLEILGYPVFYTPYLSHPDPTVKRASGFLAPNFGNSSNLGVHATVPYFWAIAPEKDFTFSPTFTSSAGDVMAGEYRQRFSVGELRVSGSLTPNSNLEVTDAAGNITQRDAVRGHFFGRGRWSMDETWRSGIDVRRATDQTYLRRYRFGGTENYLTNRAFLEGFESRSFTALNAYAFQTLRAGTQDATQPVVLPTFSYNWVGQPDSFGGRLGIDANALNIWRDLGTDSRRLSLGSRWERPYTGPIGDVYKFSASLRGDAYYETDLARVPGGPEQSGFDGRVFPQVALEWRYPWVRRGENWSQFIEPIALLAAAPRGLNGGKKPNEDSVAFDYDETHLFVPNRFPGLDRVDSGQRIDYGLRAAIFGDGGGSSTLLVGQSRRLQRNADFPTFSGLQNKTSDIVGRASISPGSWFDVVYRFRLDSGNLEVNRQEVALGFGPEKLRFGLSYLDLPPPPDQAIPERRHQITAGTSFGLTRYWSAGLSTTQDLSGQRGTVSSGIAATYRDECLAFITSLTQSGTRDRDLHPGTTIVVVLVFKNLGEVLAPVFQQSGQ